jgi:hypothetical protein
VRSNALRPVSQRLDQAPGGPYTMNEGGEAINPLTPERLVNLHGFT